MRGLLIVFEGIDGSGTTTQARMLHEAFLRSGRPAHLTQEPSDGPVGHVIRNVLSGRLIVKGITGFRPPGWATMALLFAADRVDHIDAEIVPNLEDGVHVICDRYVHSSLIYQTVTSGKEANANWIAEINRRAMPADLTIVLDTRPSTAAERRMRRRARKEIYDDVALQERLAVEYRALGTKDPNGRIVIVDGNRTPEEIHRDCWAAVDHLRGGGTT